MGKKALTQPISWSCVKHFITRSGPFTWSIQPSWLLPFRPILKWIVHLVCLDQLFFSQRGELDAINDRSMRINLSRLSLNAHLLPLFWFYSFVCLFADLKLESRVWILGGNSVLSIKCEDQNGVRWTLFILWPIAGRFSSVACDLVKSKQCTQF